GDARRVAVRRQLLDTARGFLNPRHPGDLNQAMMELGATICHPQQPACARCPLRDGCGAFKENCISDFPPPAKRAPVVEEYQDVLIIRDKRGRYLLERKTDGGALQGLWCFPMRAGSEEARSTRKDGLGTIRHSIMNRRMILNIVKGAKAPGGSRARGRYVTREEISGLPRSSIVDKVLRLL
ncbi:MAG: NUDIX domain-containing protein, partial [Candidatus Eisenbacteria bacterium]|nr:NUDIX domain-containing protein [Candidatus Eisenbacteria bacterium]